MTPTASVLASSFLQGYQPFSTFLNGSQDDARVAVASDFELTALGTAVGATAAQLPVSDIPENSPSLDLFQAAMSLRMLRDEKPEKIDRLQMIKAVLLPVMSAIPPDHFERAAAVVRGALVFVGAEEVLPSTRAVEAALRAKFVDPSSPTYYLPSTSPTEVALLTPSPGPAAQFDRLPSTSPTEVASLIDFLLTDENKGQPRDNRSVRALFDMSSIRALLDSLVEDVRSKPLPDAKRAEKFLRSATRYFSREEERDWHRYTKFLLDNLAEQGESLLV